jgi:hypothetical protein
MALSQLDQWLRQAGYEYHCFVSYPRIKKADGSIDAAHPINQCAREVRDALVRHLAFSVPEPKVFLDLDMSGGTDWEARLRTALCRSVVMVAICAGIYYHPSHRWCGLEWAAMDALGRRRLRDSDLLAIFPLMLKREKSLPPAVGVTQWGGDLTGAALSRRYYSTISFSRNIEDVVAHIERVADAIRARNETSRCGEFHFPQTSAFAEWQADSAEFPLTGRSI